jgi:hypothetical protein
VAASPVQMRVTWVGEYMANPDHYPGCDGDPVKMAALDQESLDQGIIDVADLLDETLSRTIVPAASSS